MGAMTLGGGLVSAVTATVLAATVSAGHLAAHGSDLARAPSVTARPLAGAGEWAWPLAPEPDVLARFAAPDPSWLPGHRGVDLAAGVRQVVLSPTAGVVSFSGVLAGRGVVVVAHPGGLRSTFEPVVDGPPVGSPVAAGAPIGMVGPTPGHCAPATCLHWGVLRGRTYLDPLEFVVRAPVVLLPLR
ncbi:peptidase M23 [Intrasporangium oryzae NRRL B-24470]|uniref:Peptidase M23 n=2 Tax=Intrasporangium TaxID=53357 RepID=W9G5U9_9MICO|nr:peptidase M23 [Intrasporangium oryzae NRRL B-24470]